MIILIWLAWVLFTGAVSGWAFMIAVGVAHAEWVPIVPTIGFGAAWIIMSLLSLAFSLQRLQDLD